MEMYGKKITIYSPGSYDKLLVTDFLIPKLQDNEVLIECRACGVNFADCCIRMGVYRSANEFVGWPITPGFEVSGIVIATGKNVNNVSVGQKVLGITLFGGYTSHLIIPADQVFPLPNSFTYSEGASFPTIFLTAYYGLLELAHSHEGDRILVHSAAGGVGSALIQLANLSGCRVAGVVGNETKVNAVKQLGAEIVIDKSSCDLWKELKKSFPTGFDIILDANGPETLKQSYNHLDKGGKLIVYGFHTMLSKSRGKVNWIKAAWDYLTIPKFNPLTMTNENKSIMAFNLSYLFDKKDVLNKAMLQLLYWADNKQISLPSITTYALDRVSDAHRALESGNTIGKLVLIP